MDVLFAYWVVGVMLCSYFVWDKWGELLKFPPIDRLVRFSPPSKVWADILVSIAIGGFFWPVAVGWLVYIQSIKIYWHLYDLQWWWRLPPHIRRIAKRNKNPRG